MAHDAWKAQAQSNRRAEGLDPYCPLITAEQARLGISSADVNKFCEKGCFDKRCTGGRRDCKSELVQTYRRKYGLYMAMDGNTRTIERRTENYDSSLNSRKSG